MCMCMYLKGEADQGCTKNQVCLYVYVRMYECVCVCISKEKQIEAANTKNELY